MKFGPACMLGLAIGGSARLAPPGNQHDYDFPGPQYHANIQNEALKSSGNTTSRFLTEKTSKFVVNGSAIPEVDFDIGESYAGQLPISDNDADGSMYFWFFPTVNEQHKHGKEIILWLTGGPGCSSLLAFLEENGPFLWQAGTLTPSRNPFSWHLLTNVVWVDQPLGVGFSEGPLTITNDDQLTKQFLGFWKNFINTFAMQGYKVYLATESYGGFFGPYIASHMLDANDTTHFDMQGMLIYDGLISDVTQMLQRNVALSDYVEQNREIIPLDDDTTAWMRNMSQSCGFDDWLDKYLKFPPNGHAPREPPSTKILPNGTAVVTNEDCFNFWYTLALKAANFNPCISNYNIIDHCPYPWDYVKNSQPYWNRVDVKKAINAPVNVTWEICAAKAYDTPDGMDTSLSPDHKQLPQVIEATQNVIIAHGALDYALPLNGVLMGIQNMTWGGKQGFQTAPCAPFYVPHFTDSVGTGYAANLPGGSGVVGTTHAERGLTLAVTALAGHMGAADSAAGAMRHVEKLLGRVKSLSEIGTFTLPKLSDITQDQPPLGRGVVQIPCFGTKCYTDGQCQS